MILLLIITTFYRNKVSLEKTKNMKNFLVMLSISMYFIACEKQEIKTNLQSNWENCREKNDKSATFQKMIGKWKLVATGCGFCGKPGIQATNENVELVILPDSVVKTYKNAVFVKTSKFTLNALNYPDYFTLETIPLYENLYTSGVIEQCENKIAFKNSYVDGSDWFFEKIK